MRISICVTIQSCMHVGYKDFHKSIDETDVHIFDNGTEIKLMSYSLVLDEYQIVMLNVIITNYFKPYYFLLYFKQSSNFHVSGYYMVLWSQAQSVEARFEKCV